MDHLPSPFSPLPLQTQNQSETSSPPSSRTTSPPSSPTSRKAPHFTLYHQPPTSHPNDHPHPVSILPCAVLRGRSSMMVLRRRPSAIDMALSEERSRCDGNAIERQGLDLMEPRPVGMNAGFERARTTSGSSAGASGLNGAGANGSGVASVQGSRDSRRVSGAVPMKQPQFVMGGIFEVMEGRA